MVKDNAMRLSRYSLVRIGGSSFDNWEAVKFQNTLNSFQKYVDKIHEKELIEIKLVNALTELVDLTKDLPKKYALINLKRSIVNRAYSKKQFRKAEGELPEDLKLEIISLFENEEACKDLFLEFEKALNSELSLNRKILQQVSKSPALLSGLSLSSQTLIGQLEAYQAIDGEMSKTGKQTEFGLLKYLTRMYTKTSPFSTFTNLMLGEMAPVNKSNWFEVQGDVNAFTSEIKLSGFLLLYTLELLKSYKEANYHSRVKINPTITRSGPDKYSFLTNSFNIESFQEIQSNDLLELVEGKFLEAKNIKFSELQKFLENEVDASGDEIHSFIRELIDLGFLEFDFGLSGVDPNWSYKLIEYLEYLNNNGVAHITDLQNAVSELKQVEEKFSSLSPHERLIATSNALSIFRKVYDMIPKEIVGEEENQSEETKPEENKPEEDDEKVFKHRSPINFKIKPEQILYEDTKRSALIRFDENKVNRLIEGIKEMVDALWFLDLYIEERERMKHVFLEEFKSGQYVELLEFYKVFTQKTRGKQIDQNEIPSLAERKNAILEWKEQFVKNIQSKKSSEGTIQLSKSDISHYGSLSNEQPGSYGCFAQVFQDQNDLKCVLNSQFAGNGKMFSRFLDLFDPKLTEFLREDNRSLATDNELFFEGCDNTFFNANMRPSLLDYELEAPGSSNVMLDEKRISVNDLQVFYDQDTKKLTLWNKKLQRKCYFFDLGFQGLGRSKLYHFLQKFSRGSVINFRAVVRMANEQSMLVLENEKLKILPRIIYNNDIIIQRRTWMIEKDLLPLKQKSIAEEFSKVNSWRKLHNIPKEVFVSVVQIETPVVKPEDSKGKADTPIAAGDNKINGDNYKPQFIDFQNPFLVSLFLKITQKTTKHLKIEEMLPAVSDMMKLEGQKFATENLFQWTA